MNRRFAILDLGTNTFHLLIAELVDEGFKTVYKEKIPVKIGQGGISEGHITREAELRAIKAMIHFKKVINSYDIQEVIANATSAFRNAKNGKSLAKKLTRITGIRVNIISGDHEAELIYLGIKKALSIGRDLSLVLDIGGGSNEFIICNDQKIYWKESFEIGAQRLVDLFHHHDPILAEDIERLEKYLDEKLKTLRRAIRIYQPATLIGASGTFDSLAEICRAKNNLVKSPHETEYNLPVACYKHIHQEIISKNKADRLLIPGLIEMRVDFIVVSSTLVNYLINKYRFSNIRISGFSLKEGIIQDLLNSIHKSIEVS
ncbi:MAG: Ppx/GppA phosphatase family protein [Candidatus Cyclobacteriaceae bacterium M3_2C_046]